MQEIQTAPIKTRPFIGCEALGGYEIILDKAPLNELETRRREKGARLARRQEKSSGKIPQMR
jgi:hypothetical protein